MPQRLTQLLLKNRLRVIDMFRQMDENEDGVITPDEFAKCIKALGQEDVRVRGAPLSGMMTPPSPSRLCRKRAPQA